MAATIVAVTASILWLDIPVALLFLHNANHFPKLGIGLGSEVLVAGEMAVMVGIAIWRFVRGRLPPFAKALFLACCASMCAFLANDAVLKPIFGRPNPTVLLKAVPAHVFYFFRGDEHSSFPSGHMVMATAFATAMIRLQPRTWLPLVLLLCMGATLLIVGDWHFVGDVIAGAFVGATAGGFVTELWLEHVRLHGLLKP